MDIEKRICNCKSLDLWGEPVVFLGMPPDEQTGDPHLHVPPPSDHPTPPQCPFKSQPFDFKLAVQNVPGIQRFIRALDQADLIDNYINTFGSPLTILAPADQAFERFNPLPSDKDCLRDLMFVHIIMGNLTNAELMKTRSITTLSHQTHHVVPAIDSGHTQVGSATLVQPDIQLPDGRGVLHVIDSVQCCIRLLVHCRKEQVFNKSVRPSPKVALVGEWKQQTDELHSMLIHCDTWNPCFNGLRGAAVPLGMSANERVSRCFHDGVVHFSDLFILEKPPEMSRKRRRKKDREPEDEVDNKGFKYRMMFSLFRRYDAKGTGNEPNKENGKHLTFCMVPEDIIIRNSFHMLSDAEKNARRSEYKSSSADGGACRRVQGKARVMGQPMPLVDHASDMTSIIPAQALQMSEGHSERPELDALSLDTGSALGATTIWVQGRGFSNNMQINMGGHPAEIVSIQSDTLAIIRTPPMVTSEDVEVIARNASGPWSSPLPFRYLPEVDADLINKKLALLSRSVQKIKGCNDAATKLRDRNLTVQDRLFHATLALLISGKNGSLDLGKLDDAGNTLLHYAVSTHNVLAVGALLKAGADPDNCGNSGKSSRELAEALHNKAVLDLFKKS